MKTNMIMKMFPSLVVTLVILSSVIAWDLTLLHVNDIHVRMEETNKYSSNCKPRDKQAGKCFGGLSRLSQAVKDIKHQEDNVVWLNAGDFFQGTMWYTQFKWRVVALFNNLLDFDAMTLGNHEFDDKIEGLVPFLANQTCPVVVSNFNTSLVPSMQGLYAPSTVLSVGGRAVGIVGYLTPETKHISNPEQLIITDEIEALKVEVEKLQNDGVEIIIALGHSGYEKDMEIAKAVPGVDVIVGGHSHSFLYTESISKPNPSVNSIRGPYPTLVDNPAGHKTLVLQAYAYTKYLGHVKLSFSDAGLLTHWQGEPILLDSTYKQDMDIEAELDPWRQQLSVLTAQVIGTSGEVLSISRGRESKLGNFVVDAMVRSWENSTMPDGSRLRLGVANSGGIRATIDAGNVTMEDLMTSFPFQNTFDVITIVGKHLKDAFEHSVEKMTSKGKGAGGRFLQVSGFKLKFNLNKKPGARLESVRAICDKCSDGFEDVADETVYNVVTSNYVAGGGDGYKMFLEHRTNYIIGALDTDVIQNELEKNSPISAKLEKRILIVTDSDEDQETVSNVSVVSIDKAVFCILLLFSLLA
eukprot:GFUD01093483.1.p1 GENE.GFUD01093483.1~~GFUD01093483.1.p1  ORF type:complete len:581 (+),score=153.54 GFUD01093483.1:319-2061(+)